MAAERSVRPVFPERTDIGYRANNALIAHEKPVVIPSAASEKVNYEGELVVVIGKQVKNLSLADAMSFVFGYTIGNDVSERTWQHGDRTFWCDKNADTLKPMRPRVGTAVNLDTMTTIVRVNDTESLRFKAKDMILDIQTYIAAMARYLTLYPGNVIWMGTDGTSPDLKHGNVVEVAIAGLGGLRNPFVRAPS